MKKKKVAIAFGITGSYTDILANVLIGLKKHSKKFWDDIVVFHSGITGEQQAYLNKITKCIFIELSDRDFLKFVSKEQIELYSIATFFRFESFSLLDKYDKVIWSDVDVLFQGDLSELLVYGDKSGYAGTFASDEYRVENNFFELIEEYNMFVPMLNAGLFVISDKLVNYKEIQQWCYKSTIKYGSKLRWLDQGILNLMIQEFDIDVEPIDLNRFHCHPTFEKYRDTAVIVHAHGLRKFWNDVEFQKLFPEWYDNYKEWLKIYPHENGNLIYDYLPLVSVVMSVYNRYDYLAEAIESILNQTYSNFELIIVVEKSDIQSKIANFIKKYKDSRIKVINNEKKLGFSASLNVGIDHSKGKYIARMDDDDISLPLRLEKEVQFMEDNSDVGVCDTNAEFFMNADGLWYYNNPTSEEIKSLLLVLNPICHPSVMMRKSVLIENNLKYDSNYFSEDYELWSRVIEYSPICHIDEVLLKYRASSQNITSLSGSSKKIKESVKKTIKHQFMDNLGLDLNDNELELLQRQTDIVSCVACHDDAVKWQQKLYKRILEKNEQEKYYNQEFLKKLFNISSFDSNSNNNILKRIVKKIFKPFYMAYKVREQAIIQEQLSLLNDKVNYLVNCNLEGRNKKNER